MNEVTSPGTVIGRVVARDDDIHPNDRIQYQVVDGAQGDFYVEKVSGMGTFAVKEQWPFLKVPNLYTVVTEMRQHFFINTLC